MPTSPPAPGERTLQATGARRAAPGVPTVEEIVRKIRTSNPGEGPFIALFDARSIGGERHLLSAWAHLGRARSRNETRLRDRSAEFALYVAGDDQLPRALGKVGVGPTTEEFVVVAERPRDLAATLGEFGLVSAPGLYPRPPRRETLERLGIPPEEYSLLPEGSWEGLVLERVAFVELSAAHANPPSHPTKKA